MTAVRRLYDADAQARPLLYAYRKELFRRYELGLPGPTPSRTVARVLRRLRQLAVEAAVEYYD